MDASAVACGHGGDVTDQGAVDVSYIKFSQGDNVKQFKQLTSPLFKMAPKSGFEMCGTPSTHSCRRGSQQKHGSNPECKDDPTPFCLFIYDRQLGGGWQCQWQ